MTSPHIIHDPEDLNQVDGEALLLDGHGDILAVDSFADFLNDHPQLYETLFPAVVIATGNQVRAARKVLEKEQA